MLNRRSTPTWPLMAVIAAALACKLRDEQPPPSEVAYPVTEKITGLAAAGASPVFSWDPVKNAERYAVLVTQVGEPRFSWAWTGTTSSATFGDPGDEIALLPEKKRERLAKKGATYRFTVLAFDGKGGAIRISDTSSFVCSSPCGD